MNPTGLPVGADKPPIAFGLRAAELAGEAFEAMDASIDDGEPARAKFAFETGLEHYRHAQECCRANLRERPKDAGSLRLLAELVMDVVLLESQIQIGRMKLGIR